MNLEESNEFIKEQQDKKRKKNIVLGLIIICIIFLILLIFFIVLLNLKESNSERLFINGQKNSLSSTLFVIQDEKEYVSVKEMANIAGYKYIQGEYETYTKEDNSCYLQNVYEIVSIKADSNIIKKYLQNSNTEDNLENVTDQSVDISNSNKSVPEFFVASENDTLELFQLENEVILINNNLYVPIENIGKIFNVSYSVKGKSRYIYNLNNLYNSAKSVLANLKQKGKDISSINNYYENIVALCDNMIVVNDSNGNCGVISLADYNYVLESIYTDIRYIQNEDNFFVYTKNKNKTTVGVLNKEGKKIIKPTEYESLEVFDEINKLYLAKSEDGFGIVNAEDEIIPTAYESIGLSDFEKYELEESETPNLLEGKYVVVKENEKYGLYNLEIDYEDGENKLLPSKYDELGCLVNSRDKKDGLESVLIIPEEIGVHGIVIKQNDYYGIFDLDRADIVIPCSVSKIYSKTESGEKKYFLEGDGFLYDLEEYFETYPIE